MDNEGVFGPPKNSSFIVHTLNHFLVDYFRLFINLESVITRIMFRLRKKSGRDILGTDCLHHNKISQRVVSDLCLKLLKSCRDEGRWVYSILLRYQPDAFKMRH